MEVRVLEGTKIITANQFACRKDITSVIIPDSVTSIEEAAFADCWNLSSVIIPDSVTSIDTAAFARCLSLDNVDIPASVHYIADYAFQGCDSLQTITFGGLTKMDVDAGVFEDCTSLKAIKVPNRYLDIYADMIPDALQGLLIGRY